MPTKTRFVHILFHIQCPTHVSWFDYIRLNLRLYVENIRRISKCYSVDLYCKCASSNDWIAITSHNSQSFNSNFKCRFIVYSCTLDTAINLFWIGGSRINSFQFIYCFAHLNCKCAKCFQLDIILAINVNEWMMNAWCNNVMCKRASLNCLYWNRSKELHCEQCFYSNDFLIVTFYSMQNVSKSCLTIKVIWLAGITLLLSSGSFIRRSLFKQVANVSSGQNFYPVKLEIRSRIDVLTFQYLKW